MGNLALFSGSSVGR